MTTWRAVRAVKRVLHTQRNFSSFSMPIPQYLSSPRPNAASDLSLFICINQQMKIGDMDRWRFRIIPYQKWNIFRIKLDFKTPSLSQPFKTIHFPHQIWCSCLMNARGQRVGSVDGDIWNMQCSVSTLITIFISCQLNIQYTLTKEAIYDN